ncbi:MAG: hypothetical protein QNK05_17515 [Myxococcota bacterium]|nr:hypothetical protein [Myxococcota bacterium]
MSRTLPTLCLLALGLALPRVAIAEGTTQIDPVVRLADGAVVGESTLYRSDDRVSVVVRTTDLDPGSAVTVWWRIYNRPARCATSPCTPVDLDVPGVGGSQLHATGVVVGEPSGAATLVATAYRTAGQDQDRERFRDSLPEGFLKGPGLRRPLDAEVHLVILSHGEALPASFDQLTTPSADFTACQDDTPSPERRFRCGALQGVSHQP